MRVGETFPMLKCADSTGTKSSDCGEATCSCGVVTYTMDVLSLIKHSILTDDTNPITKYFELGRQVGSAGPEMVWKIFEAIRLEDKKVRQHYFLTS